MGAGISQELQVKAFQLVETVRQPDTVKRSNALKELWNLSHNDAYKEALCHPKLQLLEVLREVLTHQQEDRLSIRFSIFCIWYLSRELKNRCVIASRAMGLIATFMALIRDEEWKEPILKIVSNCVLTSVTHEYLLSDEVGLFAFCRDEMREAFSHTISCYHRFFANIATVVQSRHVFYFIQYSIPQFMLNKLILFGTKPFRWPNRVNGVPYWCLNFLMAFSTVREGGAFLKSLKQSQYFIDLMNCEDIEGIKAAVIVTNMHCRDCDFGCGGGVGSESCSRGYIRDNNRGSATILSEVDEIQILRRIEPILKKYSHLNAMLLEIYLLQLQYDPSNTESRNLASRGYAYGIIQLRDIASLLRNIAINWINKRILLEHFSLLLKNTLYAIQLFIDNSPECTAKYEIAMIYGGGGGKDVESVEYLLEFLLQVSFAYDLSSPSSVASSEEVNSLDIDDPNFISNRREFNGELLQEQFQIYENNILMMLTTLLQLPPERQVTLKTKQIAIELLQRLQLHSSINEATKYIHSFYYLTVKNAEYPAGLQGLLEDLQINKPADLKLLRKSQLALLASMLTDSSRRMFCDILQIEE